MDRIESIKNVLYNSQSLVNELTEELDKYTKNNNGFRNYVYVKPIDEKWIIRYPGSSNGYIKVRDNIVTEIKLYEDHRGLYEDEAEKALQKFIGYKFEIFS